MKVSPESHTDKREGKLLPFARKYTVRTIVVVFLVIVLALLAAAPAAAGFCKAFGHAWAEFGQSGEAGAVVSSLASNGDSGPFPVDDGPGVMARIIHFEMESVYPCE